MSGVVQSGTITPGHIVVWAGNGIIADGGTVAPSATQGLSVIQTGTVTPGHVVTWASSGIVQDGGTSPPAPSPSGPPVEQSGVITPGDLVVWVTTGVVADGGGGAGTVFGPNGATNGNIAEFNGSTGRILKDSGVSANAPGGPGAWTNDEMNFYAQFLVGGINATDAFQSQQQGNNSTPAVTAGISIPGTATVHEGTSLFACVDNSSTVTEGVAGTFFSVASASATAGSFGINVLVSDNGFPTAAVVGCEWDIGAANVSTWAVGNNMIAVFPNGTPTRSTGYQVSANSVDESVANPWQVGFATAEGACVTGFASGPLLNGTTSPSQPMTFYAIGTDGTINGVNLQSEAYSGGRIDLIAQTGEGGFVNTGSLVQEGNALFNDGIAIFPETGAGTLLAQFTAYTSQAITTTSGDTPIGSTSLVVASAAGVTMGQTVGSTGPAIAAGTTVSSVVGTTIHISAATLSDIPSGTAVEFSTSSAVGSITTNGTATAYNTTSDHRLKDIYGLSNGAILGSVRVYEGRFKGEDGPTRPMVLAHELQAVAPFWVTGDKDAITQGGAILPQMVDHGGMVPALIARTNDHEARISAIEQTIRGWRA